MKLTVAGILAIILAFQCGLSFESAHAVNPSTAGEDDPRRLASRLENVKRLVTTSSGAQRVEASDSPDAKSRLESARSSYHQAMEAYDRKQYTRASELLNKTTAAMFEAMRLAGTGGLAEQKERHDFDSKAESVDVLIQAMERIGNEKGQSKETQKQLTVIGKLVSEANMFADAGRLREGRKILDGAYDMAKIAIEDLRGGDTLVRSLHFENKQEEYIYELDRNDTHRMLVVVLLRDKQKQQGTDRMVQTFIDQSTELRKEAEQQAGTGDFARAIETLEESTKNLVRAIRAAGVYIPG